MKKLIALVALCSAVTFGAAGTALAQGTPPSGVDTMTPNKVPERAATPAAPAATTTTTVTESVKVDAKAGTVTETVKVEEKTKRNRPHRPRTRATWRGCWCARRS